MENTQTAGGAKFPTGKEPLTEDYPGLEPAFVPSEALFKFKGQDPLLRGESSTGNIRAVAGAAAVSEVGVYHMAQHEMTFRDTPLNAAVSIAPRHRLGRSASSLGPEAADWQSSQGFDVADGRATDRTRSSLDRTRSSLADPATRSLIERTGSSIAQYDAQVNTSHMLQNLHACQTVLQPMYAVLY